MFHLRKALKLFRSHHFEFILHDLTPENTSFNRYVMPFHYIKAPVARLFMMGQSSSILWGAEGCLAQVKAVTERKTILY